MLEVDAKRDECESALLELGGQFPNLVTMEEQLTIAQGVHIVQSTLLVGRDMHTLQRHRTVVDDGVPVLQRATTITKGFHLRAGERDARLEDVFDRVLMTGFSIGGHNVRHGEQ